MATEFLGCTVLVTLHSPQDAQLRGVVIDISHQMLFLNDVCWLATGHRTPTFQIASSNLADLEVLPEGHRDVQVELQAVHARGPRSSISPLRREVNESIPSSLRGSFSHPGPIPAAVSKAATASAPPPSLAFHDPAILSTVRPSSPSIRPQAPTIKDVPPPIPRQMLAEAERNSPSKATPAIPESHLSNHMHSKATQRAYGRMDSFATLSEPFDDLSIEKSQDEPESEAAELGTDGGKEHVPAAEVGQSTRGGRRVRRTARGKRNQEPATLPPHVEEADSSPVHVKGQMQILRRKNTKPESPVIVEPDSFVFDENGNKKSKKRPTRAKRRDGIKVTEATNGWATEDATDIQELGDFDFLANHAKFNKKEIFRQMKRDDTTADESRLVSHNRLQKPGTRGGRDLHWSENVLEVPHVTSNGVAKWNSEAGESDEDASEAKLSSGRDSRRAPSRQGTFRAPSRKSSAKGAEMNVPSDSATGAPVAPAIRPTITATARSPNVDISSPRAKGATGASPYLASIPSSRPSLRLNGTNKSCPTLSPLQMLEYEQFAITELGLTEEMLAENAARGIAQTAIAVLRDANKNASFLKSHVVVAVGNHRSGARAIAAARHLHCHGFRVTLTLMGSDHDEDLLDTVRQQVRAFRKAGGTVAKSSALLANLRASAASALPNLIIDALLGIHVIFDDLRGDDQAWYYELVLLVNRNEWRVLSVDVPSGLDAVTGEMSHTDATPSQALAFFPAAVVSLAAPKPWILATLRETPRAADSEPLLYLADIGLSNVVWKRRGNRRSKGIEFAGEWVRSLRYDPGGE